jgi:ERCC4-type nuclease
MYILEGSTEWTGKGTGLFLEVDRKSVISSVINTQLRDGIRIVSTHGLDDTCEFLIQVLMRVAKEPSKYVNIVDGISNTLVATKEDYIAKHKVSSAKDLFFFQMTQVPGISAKTAATFVKEFGTMKGFYERMSVVEEEQRLGVLMSLTIEENGKKRRINRKVAESIVNYMFSDT